MSEKDTYKTIEKVTLPILYKDKSSKFFGYAFPVLDAHEVKLNITRLKNEYHTARHWCYAYQIGTENIKYRVNDDGEPNNSAGMPIYKQIQAFGVTNILVVVVRYFGGVKLGMGGLIRAYKTTANLVLEQAAIIEKTVNSHFLVTFSYKSLNTVMRIIKENNMHIIEQKLELDCNVTISTRKNNAQNIYDRFNKLYGICIHEIKNN